MISHDRYFLDAAATGIIDLENHRIHSYRGGYTRYMDTKTRETTAYEKAYEKQQEEDLKELRSFDKTQLTRQQQI